MKDKESFLMDCRVESKIKFVKNHVSNPESENWCVYQSALLTNTTLVRDGMLELDKYLEISPDIKVKKAKAKDLEIQGKIVEEYEKLLVKMRNKNSPADPPFCSDGKKLGRDPLVVFTESLKTLQAYKNKKAVEWGKARGITFPKNLVVDSEDESDAINAELAEILELAASGVSTKEKALTEDIAPAGSVIHMFNEIGKGHVSLGKRVTKQSNSSQ